MAGENFKNVDKYWGIWYSVLYGMQEMCWINFNMGCFEIFYSDNGHSGDCKINFNMGCFEIRYRLLLCSWIRLINFNMGCFEMIEIYNFYAADK